MDDTSPISGSRSVLGFVEVAISLKSLSNSTPRTITKYPLPEGLDRCISVDIVDNSPNYIVEIATKGLPKDADVLFKGQLNWRNRKCNGTSDEIQSGEATSDALWVRGNGRFSKLIRSYTSCISGRVTVYGPSASKTLPDVSALRSLTALADVTLRAAGRDFPAHSVVLAARSPVFLAMFTSDFKEANNKVADIAVDCSAEVFAVFVDYLYSGKLDERSCADRLALLELAERYMMANLKAECVRQLLGVGVEEALEVFQAGMHRPYVPMEVSSRAGQAIRDNWEAVSSSVEWGAFAAAKPFAAFAVKAMVDHVKHVPSVPK